MQTYVIIALVLAVLIVVFRRMAGGKSPSVSPSQASDMMQKAKPCFVDVRTVGELSGGRIKGAKHIPLSELSHRAAEVPKDRPVIVYCASGMRSRMAVGMLSRAGCGEVYNLSGGIAAWRRAGLPVHN